LVVRKSGVVCCGATACGTTARQADTSYDRIDRESSNGGV